MMLLNTVSGLQITPEVLHPNEVKAYDIAWGLHHLNLFGGQAPLAWDGLSHAGLAYLLYVQGVKGSTKVPTTLALLLAGAYKVYLGDVAEHNGTPALSAIYERFNVSEESISDVEWDKVARYDQQATAVAFHILFPEVKNGPKMEYDMPRYPLLIKAKVPDYMDLLKQLSINNQAQDIAGLFELPVALKPILVAEKAATPVVEHNVEIEVRDISAIERAHL
jgi:hypothetical protein